MLYSNEIKNKKFKILDLIWGTEFEKDNLIDLI